MLKVGYVECYGAGKIKLLRDAVRRLEDRGLRIELKARYAGYEKDYFDEEFLKWLSEAADAVILHIHPSIKGYDKLKHTIEKVKVPVFSIEYGGEGLSRNVDVEHLSMFSTYFLQGGVENFENMLIFVANVLGKSNIPYKPPAELPWSGIYHPKAPNVFEDLRDYLRWYEQYIPSPKGCVGILFYRDFWVERNLNVVDALISEIEGRGFGVIPVFTWLGLKNQYPGMEEFGLFGEDVLSRFFMADGNPVIEILVNLQDFSLTPRSIGSWCEGTGESCTLLSRLNVPVIKGVISYYKTVEEWVKDKDGIDVMSLAMGVAMPEVDGVIEPIIVGAVQEEVDESTGAVIKTYVPIKRQIEYFVDRVIKWIELRRKPLKDRRVAFILHNNPCAGAETTIGMGFGLDTFESLARILKEMKRRGYYLGEELPSKGEDLIRMVKERRAVPEFRWTPVSEIVRRGGAVDFIDIHSYIKYFKTLPEDSRNRVIQEWGDPEVLIKKLEVNEDIGEEDWDRYLTKLSLGLYDGKIVIPGIKLGNIVIVPQPKRGCAGARCDGKVCKILHDPDCPPPHQWLAVYWWIENVFKADIIVHVGTHGYLEFLPGKMCGLSPSCYPQISISKLPHLYIYSVTNPMEGVIAKRRGYATIIDHMNPIMSPTESYGPFKELEELLEQYQRAKHMKDESRSKVLFEMIVDASKKANLYKEFNSSEELIEYLHGRLQAVSETQFRDGLHILGDVPRGDRLAKLLVSVIRFDSGAWPSIRRALAECLSIDYEELLEKPDEFNERLGTTNERALKTLTDRSLKIVKKVLEEVGCK